MAAERAQSSIVVKATRFVLRDLLFDVARWPLWWYSTGTVNAARFLRQELVAVTDRLSIPILFRNLLKPMYGDYSRSGRIISVIMRLIVFVFRALGLALWTVFLVAAFLVWLLVIPAVAYQLILQLG